MAAVTGSSVESGAAATAFERWQAPRVAERTGAGAGPIPRMLTAERIAEIEAQARQDGFRQGLEEGRAAGVEERQRAAGALLELIDSCVPQIRLLDEALIGQLSMVVLATMRQFVRRELATQPGEVVRVIREAVAVLPASESRITLHLHPQDAALVREVLHPELLERPWRIVEDVTRARGGVRIETETSTVDATLEHRLNALVTRLLGDERAASAP
jgi:flagellar assembly protein FliH